MDLGNSKVIIESKKIGTAYSRGLCDPSLSMKRIPILESVDGQAWFPDTFEEVTEESELNFL